MGIKVPGQLAQSATGEGIVISPGLSLLTTVFLEGEAVPVRLKAAKATMDFGDQQALLTLTGLVTIEKATGAFPSPALGQLIRRGNVRTIQPQTESDGLMGTNDPEWPEDVRRRVEARRNDLWTEFGDKVFRDKLPYTKGPPQRASDVRAPREYLDGRPIRMTARPIPLNRIHQEWALTELQELEDRGLITQDEHRQFSTPLFCVDKDPTNSNPRKHYRLVFDYRRVNALFPSIPTDLPQIPEVLQRAAGAGFGSAFDILAAFHQVRVHPDDRPFLAFRHPDGRHMTWTAWPFGFTYSPKAMELMVAPLLAGLDDEAVAYVDDITFMSGTCKEAPTVEGVERHYAVVRRFCQNCMEAGVYLAKSKAQFMSAELAVLGSLVRVGRSVEIDPGRLKDLRNMPLPSNLKELERSFGALA